MSKRKTKVCKYCKEEIDAKAKVCPHCRKKQGGKVKWIIIAIIVLAILGSAMGGNDEDSDNTSSNTTSTTAAKKETSEKSTAKKEKKATTEQKDSTIKVGDSFECGNLKITVNSLEEDCDGNSIYTPGDGNEYIKTNFTFENIGKSGDSYVSIYDFQCYADNTACDQIYLGDNTFVNTNLSTGKNVSFDTYYEIPKDAKKVTLEYDASVWTDKKIIIELK